MLILVNYIFLTNISKEMIDVYGNIILIIPTALFFLGLILILILIGIFVGIFYKIKRINNNIKNKQPRVEEKEKKLNEFELKQKRELIVKELNESEKQFLKNKITKDTFDSISKEKHEELIRIESLIDSKKKIKLNSEELKKVGEVSEDKKKILKGLFEQKLLKAHELNLAEQSYLKRKINEATYLKISSNIKKEIISINSQIELINKTEKVNKIKRQLKEGAKEITKQKKNTKQRNLEEIIQDDVINQLNLQR